MDRLRHGHAVLGSFFRGGAPLFGGVDKLLGRTAVRRITISENDAASCQLVDLICSVTIGGSRDERMVLDSDVAPAGGLFKVEEAEIAAR